MKTWKNAEMVELSINQTADGKHNTYNESSYTNPNADSLCEAIGGAFGALIEQVGDLINGNGDGTTDGTTDTLS